VHVVVKSFAASMAAVITTLAPHSYAYPNAVILHHQMSGGAFGNMTEQSEQLEVSKEWFHRFGQPVRREDGHQPRRLSSSRCTSTTPTEDWEEFADKAVALKWVDNVVHEIRETGVVKEPGDESDEKPKLEVRPRRGDRRARRPLRAPAAPPSRSTRTGSTTRAATIADGRRRYGWR